MFDRELNKKYLAKWQLFVIPYIKNKDFDSAKREADKLLVQLTDELGYRKLSYLFWKLR